MARAVAAVVAIALLLCAAPIASGQGGLGFRADAGTTRGGFLVVDAAPGGTASGRFHVTNSTEAEARVAVYAADALTGTTTGIVYGGRVARDRAGAWISAERSSVVVPAGAEQAVRFTVRVPADAPPGEHVGSVVIGQARSGTPAVAQVVRVVAPVLVEVPGGTGAQVQIESARIAGSSAGRASSVAIGLRNAGGRMCAPMIAATLHGPGENGRTVTRQLDTVLARDAVTYPLVWPRALVPGQYRIQVTASGCGTSQTRTLTDDVPSDDTAQPTAGRRPDAVRTTRSPATSSRERVGRPPATPAPDITLRREPPALAPGGGSTGAGGGTVEGGSVGGDRDRRPGLPERVRRLVEEHAGEALQRAGAPMALLLLFGLVVVAQEAVDRRDPKLRLAPVHRDPDLAFGPDPEADPVDHPSNLPPDLRWRQ